MAAPVTSLRSVCSECGAVYERHSSSSRCDECRPPRERTVALVMRERNRPQHRGAGYGAVWDRLSKRARKLQPFCSDCGRTDDLTADHSPEAWARQQAGKAIRLEDIDVVCRRCNSERGPARGPEAVARPTIGSRMAELAELEDEMTDDGLVPDDIDQRVARGEA